MDAKDWLFDKRVVKRNLKKALYTIKEYRIYLDQITDSSANGEYIDMFSEEDGRAEKEDKSRGQYDKDSTGGK